MPCPTAARSVSKTDASTTCSRRRSRYIPPAATPNGTAVIVCAGGGYARLAIANEAMGVAGLSRLAGVATFILKYRLVSTDTRRRCRMCCAPCGFCGRARSFTPFDPIELV